VRPIEAAAPKATPVDAATAVPPAGKGRLTVTADPFALVEVDGRAYDSTPIRARGIGAGEHVVVCRAPDSGEVIHTETVEIVEGKETKVSCN
jgi:hypothetical protein